jgi:hypothetical protein
MKCASSLFDSCLNVDLLEFWIAFINAFKFVPNHFSCVATHHIARNNWFQSTHDNMYSL